MRRKIAVWLPRQAESVSVARQGSRAARPAARATTARPASGHPRRGRGGAALWRGDSWTEHSGFQVEVRDTVGAGDAFLAVLVAGLLSGVDNEALLKAANRNGAAVAAQFGALPLASAPK